MYPCLGAFPSPRVLFKGLLQPHRKHDWEVRPLLLRVRRNEGYEEFRG